MTFDLRAALPLLIPKAIGWAEAQYNAMTQAGQPLNDVLLSVARSVGVLRPELIRVIEVPCLPLPDDPDLKQAALATGLLAPGMVGLTLGHGVCVCHRHGNVRVLSHEFRHVYQYGQAGSIAAFLPSTCSKLLPWGITMHRLRSMRGHTRGAMPNPPLNQTVSVLRAPGGQVTAVGKS